HSYIQAFERESEAFRAFAGVFPETVLLVDTYDTLEGVERVIELARDLGDDFRVRAVRLDSGDMAELSKRTRAKLDEAGLHDVGIFMSGGLDEYEIADLLARGAVADGFGVGTRMGVAEDAPSLDMAYKLTAYEGRGRVKLSPGKRILPGRKQVWRIERGGEAVGDVLGRHDEAGQPGRPLLRKVMEGGRALPAGREPLDAARERAREEIAKLPARVRSIEPAGSAYPVRVSDALEAYHDEVAGRYEG
ncbi:MAG: nicotinate phosphoribosyltransferase, partial [Gemmatimonadota bacterium]